MDRLDAVIVFVAVAEHQSFAAAARSSSGRQLWSRAPLPELEKSLRTRLFNRTTRSVALTEAGQRYLERARVLLAPTQDCSRGATLTTPNLAAC